MPEAHRETPPPDPESETVPCSACGKPMPLERKDLLGVSTCIACTKQKKPPLGTWDYPDNFHERVDGVGGLIILDPD